MTPEGVLMNRNEAGNVLWGMGANKVGIYVPISMIGGQYASLKDERTFDEKGEQFAIFYGSFIWNRTKIKVNFDERVNEKNKRIKEATLKRFEKYQNEHPLNGPKE